jgi:EAL domain-containing protein (putative c-di-GMP-specific phosphodiesterase class I)
MSYVWKGSRRGDVSGRAESDALNSLTGKITVLRSLVGNSPHARSEAHWSLVAHDGGEIVPLPSFPCLVGRHPGAVVRIAHGSVSLSHAEFRATDEGLVVVDLESRNGTFVNGQRVAQPTRVCPEDLIQFGAAVFRLQNDAKAELSVTCQSDEDIGDLALALAQFEKLLHEPLLLPVYQPIVTVEGQPVAYEALGRSSLFGLDKPAMMFRAAAFFHMEAELSRLLRKTELTTSCEHSLPHLFLNTHPAELADFKQLVLSLREIRNARPQQPITLEVHEAAAADLTTMKMLRLALADLNMRLAYDDFGAGQARLAELVEARPEFVKFDRKLISGIDKNGKSQQRMVQSLVKMCRQLGIITLAEGVETAAEAAACRKLGFELMQGYYFGKPEEPALSPVCSSSVETKDAPLSQTVCFAMRAKAPK